MWRLIDKVRLRINSLRHRPQIDSELEAELQVHLDQLAEENVASGNMPPDEARQADPTDNASHGKVAIVNETLAKRIWNPIGQRLRPPSGSFGSNEEGWHTVIGAGRAIRHD